MALAPPPSDYKDNKDIADYLCENKTLGFLAQFATPTPLEGGTPERYSTALSITRPDTLRH